MLCPRIHPAVCACLGRLYVFGGRNSKKVELKSVEVFDPETNSWSLMDEGMKVLKYHAWKMHKITLILHSTSAGPPLPSPMDAIKCS